MDNATAPLGQVAHLPGCTLDCHDRDGADSVFCAGAPAKVDNVENDSPAEIYAYRLVAGDLVEHGVAVAGISYTPHQALDLAAAIKCAAEVAIRDAAGDRKAVA